MKLLLSDSVMHSALKKSVLKYAYVVLNNSKRGACTCFNSDKDTVRISSATCIIINQLSV